VSPLTVSGDIGHTTPLDIGSMGGIGARSFFFHAVLDEVRVYNTALSSGNVSTVMGENADTYGATYDYSALGNIIYQGGDTAYSYGSSSHVHAVTAVGPNSYTYDANGNMTARGSQTLTWDTENRVSQVTWGGNTTTMTYESDGRRVKKVEGGVTLVYPNRYYTKIVTTGVVLVNYFLGGMRVAFKVGSDLVYVHNDHLGGPVVNTDSAGATRGSEKFYPFGYQRVTTGSPATDQRQFNGEIVDDTNLQYLGARSYDVTLGRFVSADPVVPNPANPQSLNRYSYVLNNPLRYTDPTGYSEEGAALFGCDPCEWWWDGSNWDFGQAGTHRDSPTHAILGDTDLGIPSAAAEAAAIGDPDLPPMGAQTSAAAVQGAAPVQAGGGHGTSGQPSQGHGPSPNPGDLFVGGVAEIVHGVEAVVLGALIVVISPGPIIATGAATGALIVATGPVGVIAAPFVLGAGAVASAALFAGGAFVVGFGAYSIKEGAQHIWHTFRR
jgi:RHS repeat-associated protein